MADNTVVGLGELSKPATTLVEKISDAVGGIFKPYQTVRMAKADAAASLIRAESDIQVTDLQRRAMERFVEEEAKKQANIEAITRDALHLLNNESAPQSVADDWLTNFFDKSRIVSDSEMQQVWARVLAGEANGPGAFSRKTVNLLADLDKGDAELFGKLCNFVWNIGGAVPLLIGFNEGIYSENGLDVAALLHLQSLGLIEINASNGFRKTKLPKRVKVSYFGRVLNLTFPEEENNSLTIGKGLFTRVGIELARVCESLPVGGFFEVVAQQWELEGLVARDSD